ncbi:hypothetical protein [Pandoraea oxalativorans]|uniref:Uncharacterized protein n=1 Tax=Pandoraea oxalativorans TaxID=573737 RepID=A0A0G3IHK7_9BURK|nr:hypothetical protein [Pandoraea oxalativorans]AKK24655.1 hypothetical protein MB84_27850 [Pandoraea oxalativorans]
MRKAMVLRRIARERAELVQATHVARARLRNVGRVPGLLLGGFATLSSFGTLGTLATLTGALPREPLRSVASSALGGLAHTRVGRIVHRILPWCGLGMLVWRSIRRPRDMTKLSGSQSAGAATPDAAVSSSPPARAADYPGALPLM